MKKIIASLVIAATVFTSSPVFAWCPPPPPPCRPCGGWGWGCSSGLGTAAAITSIVANGIGMASNLAVVNAAMQPRTIVVQQPTAVMQPAVAAPSAVAPVISPVIAPAAPCIVPGAGYYYTSPTGPTMVIVDPRCQTPACKGYFPLPY